MINLQVTAVYIYIYMYYCDTLNTISRTGLDNLLAIKLIARTATDFTFSNHLATGWGI